MKLASSLIKLFVSLPFVSPTRFLISLLTFCAVVGMGSGELRAQQALSPWSIVTGSGAGLRPQVNVFDGGTLVLTHSFHPYDTKARGGETHVAMGDVNGDTFIDVITGVGAGAGGGPHVKVFSGLDGRELHNFFASIRGSGEVFSWQPETSTTMRRLKSSWGPGREEGRTSKYSTAQRGSS